MRFNTIIMLVAGSLIILGTSCNNTKSSKTINDPSTTVKTPKKTPIKEPVVKATEAVKDATASSTKAVKQKTEATKEVLAEKTKATKDVVEEKKEVVKASAKQMQEKLKDANQETKKTATDKKAKDEAGVLKKVETKDILKGGKAAVSKKMTEQQMAMVGKYKWLKRVCCGRMRKVTTPKEGEEKYMTLTEDGHVKYSGNAAKMPDDCTYEISLNSKTFPERPMLKMTDRIDALMHFRGDTLLIDRGYIDLDKNYWLKVE